MLVHHKFFFGGCLGKNRGLPSGFDKRWRRQKNTPMGGKAYSKT